MFSNDMKGGLFFFCLVFYFLSPTLQIQFGFSPVWLRYAQNLLIVLTVWSLYLEIKEVCPAFGISTNPE